MQQIKDNLFSNWGWESWIAFCKSIKLEYSLTLCIKILNPVCVLSEISQRKKDKYYILSLTWHLKKKKTKLVNRRHQKKKQKTQI